MVSALDSGSSDPGSSLGPDTALCSWARHTKKGDWNNNKNNTDTNNYGDVNYYHNNVLDNNNNNDKLRYTC